MSNIEQVAAERILILDGAMGTMIQEYQLDESDYRGDRFQAHPSPLKGNNDLLVLTQPEIIKKIHHQYLEAGSDIIETNTFNGTRISQADYQLEHVVLELNTEAAKLAKAAADEWTSKTPDRPRFVAGSMGPTNKTASISPDVTDPGFRGVTWDELVDAYYEQAKGLWEGGVDLLMVETVFDTLNAKAALFAIETLFEEKGSRIPVMVSGTITDASGRTLSGQTTEAFLISMSHIPLLSIGLNCALGAKELRPYLQVLSKESPYLVSTHPNAGLPNEFGGYDQTPGEMASQIEVFLEEGLINIVGGCCGTTPDHIRELASLVKQYKPRNQKEAALAY